MLARPCVTTPDTVRDEPKSNYNQWSTPGVKKPPATQAVSESSIDRAYSLPGRLLENTVEYVRSASAGFKTIWLEYH